jgi:hypothetical protein
MNKIELTPELLEMLARKAHSHMSSIISEDALQVLINHMKDELLRLIRENQSKT